MSQNPKQDSGEDPFASVFGSFVDDVLQEKPLIFPHVLATFPTTTPQALPIMLTTTASPLVDAIPMQSTFFPTPTQTPTS